MLVLPPAGQVPMPPLAALAMAAAMIPPPALAPSVYVTSNYALTFRSPPGAFYCPLPDDWVGSDHGTTLLLIQPTACGEVGYPSSGRAFTPESTPRIEVYYGYWDAEDALAPGPCRQVGTASLMGGDQPLCRTDAEGFVVVKVTAHYEADIPAELDLTLVTTPARLARDLAAFRAMAGTARACAAAWKDDNGRPFTLGHGAPCPEDGRTF